MTAPPPRRATGVTEPVAGAARYGRSASTEPSRERIMAAASELARERGVSGATIAAVCQRWLDGAQAKLDAALRPAQP